METGSRLFVVKNYSLHKRHSVAQLVESEEFFVGGHGWTICFYPGGRTTKAHESGYLSLYLHLKTTTSKSVQFLFALHLLHQSGKGRDHIFSTFGEGLSISCGHGGRDLGYTNFIKQTYLEDYGYLKSGSLRIRATIGVLTCIDESFPIIKVADGNKWSDFGKLLQSKQGTDVFFNVVNETFCCHRWILAARCPAVLSHLSDFPKTVDIDIPDMEPKIFEVMLGFVYTGMLPEDEFDDIGSVPFTLSSFMGKLLAAADRFELKTLKNICELRISEHISEESVAYLLHLAELCHAKELKAACLGFEAEKDVGLLDVMYSDGREYLKETCPLLFLELGYKASYSTNGRKVHKFCGKILSTMKKTVVTILGPHQENDKRKMV